MSEFATDDDGNHQNIPEYNLIISGKHIPGSMIQRKSDRVTMTLRKKLLKTRLSKAETSGKYCKEHQKLPDDENIYSQHYKLLAENVLGMLKVLQNKTLGSDETIFARAFYNTLLIKQPSSTKAAHGNPIGLIEVLSRLQLLRPGSVETSSIECCGY